MTEDALSPRATKVVAGIVTEIEKGRGRPLTEKERVQIWKMAAPSVARVDAKLAELEAEVARREQARLAKKQYSPAAARLFLEIDRRVVKMGQHLSNIDGRGAVQSIAETHPEAYAEFMKAAGYEQLLNVAKGEDDAPWHRGIL
jgi:uncharacterized small protein (DUF1192 family)